MRSAAVLLVLAACFSKPSRPGDTPDGPGLPTCGDGALDDGEACDDGNHLDNDGCTAACAFEPWFECPTPGELCHKVLQLEWIQTGSLLPILGSPTGGTGYEDDCAAVAGVNGPNTAVVGLEATSDVDSISRLRALCADITLRNDGRIGWTGDVPTPAHGNNAGTNPQTDRCNDDEVVVGFDGNDTTAHASGFAAICQKLTHVAGVLVAGTPRKLAVIGPATGVNEPTEQCAGTEVARAVNGRSGAIIDGMTLRCVPTSLVICGDNKLEDPETCDDGNATPGDGCNETCSGE